MGTLLKKQNTYKSKKWKPHFSIWEKTGTQNDEESFNKLLEILDMGAISFKKHKINFGKVEPISSQNIEGFLNH